jgi:hypothetical protein
MKNIRNIFMVISVLLFVGCTSTKQNETFNIDIESKTGSKVVGSIFTGDSGWIPVNSNNGVEENFNKVVK